MTTTTALPVRADTDKRLRLDASAEGTDLLGVVEDGKLSFSQTHLKRHLAMLGIMKTTSPKPMTKTKSRPSTPTSRNRTAT